MRKLKLQVQVSLDGYMAGPNGEMDWMTWDWDEKLKNYVAELSSPVDCILLGRKLAEGFIPHWNSNPQEEGADKINSVQKLVFTRTLEKCEWPNTALVHGDLKTELEKLKSQAGGDLIVYGGGSFVADLIRHNLIDEYHLFINPAAIGKGMPVFPEQLVHSLQLMNAVKFDCGIVVLQYQPR